MSWKTLGLVAAWFWCSRSVAAQASLDQQHRLAGSQTEQVLNAVFNALVADSTWSSIFGSYRDIDPPTFCDGSTWPIPTIQSGSDLEKVLQAGVFRCGYIANQTIEVASRPSNAVLLSTTNNTVSGLIDDWWHAIIDYLSGISFTHELAGQGLTGRVAMDLAWTLYSSTDDMWNALYTGGLDGVCGYWSPGDDRYQPPSQFSQYALASVFVAQTCPTFFQSKFIYTPGTSPLSNFDELDTDVQAGSFTDMCVAGPEGSTAENSCVNTFYAFGNVDCFPTDIPFQNLSAGDCQAVWDGIPPAEDADSYNNIPYPYIFAPVTFLPPSPNGRTSLELASTKSFDSLIEDGSWNSIFGNLVGVEPTGYCRGDAQSWPRPEVQNNTDLSRLLRRGVFRCGYPEGQLLSSTGEKVMIDTTDPTNVTGLIPDFWALLSRDLGQTYGFADGIPVEWMLQESTQATFTALYEGTIDAACGYFDPQESWVDPQQFQALPVSLAFSMMHCPTIVETNVIHVKIENTGLDSYYLLVRSIEATNGVFPVCVADSATGRNTVICQERLSADTSDGQPVCIGAPEGTVDPNQWAFDSLQSETCFAVWSGYAEDATRYRVIPQPMKIAQSSFFRTGDFVAPTAPTLEPTSRPTSAPVPTASSPRPTLGLIPVPETPSGGIITVPTDGPAQVSPAIPSNAPVAAPATDEPTNSPAAEPSPASSGGDTPTATDAGDVTESPTDTGSSGTSSSKQRPLHLAFLFCVPLWRFFS